MFRGNRRQPIFLDDDDRGFFLAKLRQLKSRFDFEIHAFVLMPNHVHLVIRRGHDPLHRFMAALLTSHARYFNRKYGLVGHVFQGRYRSLACEDETYLLRLVRYVHRNPLRAGLSDGIAYPWSSYGAYLVSAPDLLVDHAPVLRRFGAEANVARESFREFHESEEAEAETRDRFWPRGGVFLGGTRFEMGARRRAARSSDPLEKRRPGLDEILDVTLGRTRFRVDPIEVRGPSRRRAASLARAAFVETAIEVHGYGYAELAGFLGRSTDSLRVLLSRHRASREPSKTDSAR